MNHSLRMLSLGSGAALLAALIFAGYGLLLASASVASAYVQAGALLAATAGWMFNNFITLRLRARDKSFAFIEQASSADRITPDLVAISEAWASEEFRMMLREPRSAADFYISGRTDPTSVIKNVRSLGNRFEEMAMMVRHGALDEEILKSNFLDMFCQFYDKYALFLPAARNEPDFAFYRPEYDTRRVTGEQMEWLYNRWRPFRSSEVKNIATPTQLEALSG